MSEESLLSARTRLARNLDEGMRCPCCGQWAQRYKRRMGASIAVPLVRMYRNAARGAVNGWLDVRPMGLRGGDYAKALYWNLIEAHPEGSAGMFRLTDKGRAFVEGKETIPEYVVVYDGKPTGEVGPKLIDIKAALGKRFSRDALLKAS